MESLTESPRSSLMRYKGNAAGGRIYTPPLKEMDLSPFLRLKIDVRREHPRLQICRNGVQIVSR